jgi:hypothetical protein
MNAATVQDYSVVSDLSGVNDKDGDWCAPQIIESSDGDDEVLVDAQDFLGDDEKTAAVSRTLAGVNLEESSADGLSPSESSPNVPKEKERADEYEDMEDESLALDESATTSNGKTGGSNSNVDTATTLPSSRKDSALLRSRRYDVSVTYDKYYQVQDSQFYFVCREGSDYFSIVRSSYQSTLSNL